MKLATMPNGTRDGTLVIVNRDLSLYLDASDIAPNLQTALDDWQNIAPKLQAVFDAGFADGQAFDQAVVHSPLPRAYQWADGSAYVNHVELVRKARNAELPESFWTDPLMYQGGSDSFLNPQGNILAQDAANGIDLEAEIAVIVDDVPMNANRETALAAIRLVMLCNDVSLRGLIPAELGKGFGFFQSKPSSAFSPVAVTIDELGDAWQDGKLHLPILATLNDDLIGKAEAGVDMTFDFGTIIAHAAKTRPLSAGAIIGSGTISNKDTDGGPGRPVCDGGLGYSCLAEVRMIETILDGAPKTPFLQFGDRVTIEMQDKEQNNIFGTIDQTVEQYHG